VRNPVSVIRNSIFLIALTFTGCSTEAAVCPFHLSRRSCWWPAESWTCFSVSSSCGRDLENNKRQQGFRFSCCQGLLKAIFLCNYKPSGFICKYTSHLVYQVMVTTVRCEEIADEWKDSKIFTETKREMKRSTENFCRTEEEEKLLYYILLIIFLHYYIFFYVNYS
jgi:hypothetical protein